MARQRKKIAKKNSAPSYERPVQQPESGTTYIAPAALRKLPAFSGYELIATGFFSGYLPIVPGTWGTLAALLWFAVAARLVPGEGLWHVGAFSISWLSLVLGALTTLVGIYVAQLLAAEWREKDPGEVVIDEFAGFFLAMLLVVPDLVGLLLAFVFFRLFDIVKPGPVAKLQELPGGYGIVLDDVLAGLMAAPCALAAQLLASRWF